MMNALAMHEGGEGGRHTRPWGCQLNEGLAKYEYLGHACSALGEDGTKLTLCDARGKQLATIRRRCNYGQHPPFPPSFPC